MQSLTSINFNLPNSKQIYYIVLFLGLIAISACASWTIKNVPPQEKVVHEEGKAIIFGNILFIENGERKVPYGWLRKPFISIHKTELEKYSNANASVDKDGNFYWIVPRGNYVIFEVSYDLMDYSIQPEVRFEVPLEGDVFYLGTLKIDVEINKILLGIYFKNINSIEIIDEFDRTKEAFINRNPDFSLEVKKNLITKIPDKSPTGKTLSGRGPFFIPMGTFH